MKCIWFNSSYISTYFDLLERGTIIEGIITYCCHGGWYWDMLEGCTVCEHIIWDIGLGVG